MKKVFLSLPAKKSVTLMELIVIMVGLGVGIAAVMTMMADVSTKVRFSENIATGVFYAQEKMEEIKSGNFSDLTIGTQGPVNIDGYRRTVTVGYCDLSGSAWVSSVSPTVYKMVTVSVQRGGAGSSVDLVTIVSNY